MAPHTTHVIETERLRLIRIWDTSLESDHLKWFHETWKDPVATQWSLHGPTTTLLSSQSWFETHLSTYDAILYIVFEKPSPSSSTPESYPGTLLGNIGLRTQSSGPTLPPFDPPSPSPSSTPPTLRSLGYAYLPSSWGRGVATEAATAVLDAYREATLPQREKGEAFYVEAVWGPENEASARVLEKVGFRTVGEKREERAWLAGGWRERLVVGGLYL